MRKDRAKRQNRGAHRQLSHGSIDNLCAQTDRLAAELGVFGQYPYEEMQTKDDTDFGLGEIMAVGSLIVSAGLINL